MSCSYILNLQVVFKEIFRIMKPGENFFTFNCLFKVNLYFSYSGAIFANYEWCLTDKFDKNNAEHW